jgi:hypothetical protein
MFNGIILFNKYFSLVAENDENTENGSMPPMTLILMSPLSLDDTLIPTQDLESSQSSEVLLDTSVQARRAEIPYR